MLRPDVIYIAAHDISWPQGRPRHADSCGPNVPIIKKGSLVRYEPSSGNFYQLQTICENPENCSNFPDCGCYDNPAPKEHPCRCMIVGTYGYACAKQYLRLNDYCQKDACKTTRSTNRA